MKRLAAVLLAISLTISGCTAAPADASNTAATTAASSDFKEAAAEAIEETEEKAAEAAEETAAEATEAAEETDEAAAGETGKTADRSAEEPAGSTDQTTVKNSLVILEAPPRRRDQRMPTRRLPRCIQLERTRKLTPQTAQPRERQARAQPQRSSLKKKTTQSWSILWDPIWRAATAVRPRIL